MKSTTLIYAFLILLTGYRTLDITGIKSIQNREAVIELVNAGSKDDEFLKKLTIGEVLGKGSYGTVFKATYTGTRKDAKGKKTFTVDVAVKLSTYPGIQDTVKSPVGEYLQKADNHFSPINRNLVPLLYLREKETPFLQNYITSRQFIMYLPKKADTPRSVKSGKQRDSLNSVSSLGSVIQESNPTGAATVQLFITGLADAGSITNVIEERKGDEKGAKIKFIKQMFFKCLLAIREINLKGYIHGDIKPDNIFVKNFNFLGNFKQIQIGDWDLAHYGHLEVDEEMTLRYSALYRPVELNLYEMNQVLVRGPNGYKFTISEDVYAMAASFVHLIIDAGLKPADIGDMKGVLDKMLAPAGFDYAYRIITDYKLGKNMNWSLHEPIKKKFEDIDKPKLKNPKFEEIRNKVKASISSFLNLYRLSTELKNELKIGMEDTSLKSANLLLSSLDDGDGKRQKKIKETKMTRGDLISLFSESLLDSHAFLTVYVILILGDSYYDNLKEFLKPFESNIANSKLCIVISLLESVNKKINDDLKVILKQIVGADENFNIWEGFDALTKEVYKTGANGKQINFCDEWRDLIKPLLPVSRLSVEEATTEAYKLLYGKEEDYKVQREIKMRRNYYSLQQNPEDQIRDPLEGKTYVKEGFSKVEDIDKEYFCWMYQIINVDKPVETLSTKELEGKWTTAHEICSSKNTQTSRLLLI